MSELPYRFARLSRMLTTFLLLAAGGLPAQIREWHPLPYPGGGRIQNAQLFSRDLGYIFTFDGKIYHYQNGDWTLIPIPAGVDPKRVFFVAEESIWLTFQPANQYRESVLTYKNGRWQRVETPNIDDINSMIFISPDEGWAGCNWGEMLHFKNGQWRQVPVPAFGHIWGLTRGPAGNLYAFTDGQGVADILTLGQGGWRVLHSRPRSAIFALFPTKDGGLYVAGDHTLHLLSGGQESAVVHGAGLQTAGIRPDGTGYVAINGAIYFLDSLSLERLTPDNQFKVEHISIAEDGAVWLWGAGLWAPEEKISPQDMTPHRLEIHYLGLGVAMGLAIFETTPHKRVFYVVNHIAENTIFDFPQSRSPGAIQRMPARSPGLNEPQQDIKHRPVYDIGVLAADFNNDGREDIFLTCIYGGAYLFINLGQGNFQESTSWAHFRPDTMFTGLAATADVDNDGDLDLFVACEREPSHLFINDGYGRFSDQAQERGVRVPQAGAAGVLGDLDNDGWVDLAVATKKSGVYIFRNSGKGYFTEITARSPDLQPPGPEKCVSLTLADYDNDGDLDLYVCKKLVSNMLLENDGSGAFHDVTAAAGLVDSSLSQGAAFFDFDNDGRLDLYIANRGPDALYRNLGHGRFGDAIRFSVGYEKPWAGGELAAVAYGRFSTGSVTFDAGNDGDLDLLVGSFDYESTFYENMTNDQGFIQFELRGSKSNRSAIGARVTLYARPAAGGPREMLGTRIIESTSGYGSHSEKLIHFGVEANRRYEAEIIFAGGDTLNMTGLSAGQRYFVTELPAGRHRLQLMKARIKNLLFGHRITLRVGQIVLIILLLLAVGSALRTRVWWSDRLHLLLVASAVSGLVITHMLLTFRSDVLYFTIPLLGSVVTAAVAVYTGRLWLGRYASEASIHALSLKLAAFDHSASYANRLASLELYLNQISGLARIDEELGDRIHSLVLTLNKEVEPEILLIAEFLFVLRFQPAQARQLSQTWRRLRRCLTRIDDWRVRGVKPDAATIARALELRHELNDILRRIRTLLASHESCHLNNILEECIAAHRGSGLAITLEPAPGEDCVHIPASELRWLVSELLANAIRAMAGCPQQKIEIRAVHNSHMQLLVRDSGRGIAPENWEKIFSRQYSTRDGGGLGLYYARKMMEHYGATIRVLESKPGEGTTMLIQLEMAKE